MGKRAMEEKRSKRGMIKRRRKNTTEKVNQGAEQQLQPWVDLVPDDLLKSVALRLPPQSLFNFQNTCKFWRSIIVESYPLGKSPLLFMYDRKIKNLRHHLLASSTGGVEVYSPLYNRSFSLPVDPKILNMLCYSAESAESHLVYSKDGWIVFLNFESCVPDRILFINPFLPSPSAIITWKMARPCTGFSLVSMSAPPTDPSCIILLAIRLRDTIQMMTGSDGGRNWKIDIFSEQSVKFTQSNHPVFHGGMFYFLDSSGAIGIYDPYQRTWAHHQVRISRPIVKPVNWRAVGNLLVDLEGELLGVFEFGRIIGDFFICKLDLSEKVWNEVREIRGRALFFDGKSAISAVAEVQGMKNRIFDTCRYTDAAADCELQLTNGEPRFIPKSHAVGLAEFASGTKGGMAGLKLSVRTPCRPGIINQRRIGIWVEPKWD